MISTTLEILRGKALLTTTRLVGAAAGMGISPAEPETLALAAGAYVIRHVRARLRRVGPILSSMPGDAGPLGCS